MEYILRSTIEQAMASEMDAACVLNGDGGDAVFGAEATRYAALDYLRYRGIRPAVLRVASQVALRTHQSTWSVLCRALESWMTGAFQNPQAAMLRTASHLVRRDAWTEGSAASGFAHPWFAHEHHIPWATVRRLGMLLESPEFYDVTLCNDVPEVVAPLYAQPVVETLLRVPLYQLFEGGRDRGLARRAFARDVPEEILARQWKDRAPGFHELLVFRNRAFLREMFLDGVLVREGLLDRAAIEEALADRPSKSQVMPGEFIRHLDVEMWARAWEGSHSAPVASQMAAALTY